MPTTPVCAECQTPISRDAVYCHRHAGLRTPQARAAARRRREVASLVALLGTNAAAGRQLGISRSRVSQLMKRQEELHAR